jgi:carbonic anhydrase
VNSYEKLLLENKLWSERMLEADPKYFARLARYEDPEFLWIGSSDSRVHPNEITGSHPGEIVIHRNFGNLVHPDDRSLESLLRHAVDDLGVQHVIVCGHTECAATRKALGGTDDPWLAPLSALAADMKDELETLSEDEEAGRLMRRSIESQVENLSQHAVVIKAWNTRRAPLLHGWLVDVKTGRIEDLFAKGP